MADQNDEQRRKQQEEEERRKHQEDITNRPPAALARGATPQQQQAGQQSTQKVKLRTRTGQHRMRAGLSIPPDYQEFDVTAEQLSALEEDDQIQILKAGEDPEKGGGQQPINVMHAAFDPALAALHPDKLRELAQKGGGQLPAMQVQVQPGNPNLVPGGAQLPAGQVDVNPRGARKGG